MKTAHFLKSDKKTSQDLSAGALSLSTSFGRKFKLEQVTIHASVAITETVTVTLVSAQGANYNVVLVARDLVGEQDFIFRPQGECNLQAGDEIKVQCTNANTTGIVYPIIKTSEM